MDNSNFLSYFTGLAETNSNEVILENAKNIINLVELTSDKEIKNEKYKDYLKIAQNPSEDLLYTVRRLIGGLASTGLEYRKGFSLTFSLLISKFGTKLNMKEILDCIEKESFVPKNEKNHIKTCALSGKLVMYRIILNQKNLTGDNLLFILKSVLNMISSKSMEESIIVLLKELFGKIFEKYYTDIKNENKLFDGIFKLLDHYTTNKNNLNKAQTNFEFTIYFILIPYMDKFKGFLPKNIKTEMFDSSLEEFESPLKHYFDILLKLPIKEGSNFNVSFSYLCSLLEQMNDKKYTYKIWNILIDPKCINSFKNISLKNFELLIYNYSSFILEKFFLIDYIVQIFDDSFFLSLLKFSSNKKFKYATNLTEIIMKKITNNKFDSKVVNDYCQKILNIYGVEAEDKYSPNSLKAFFLFLFSTIDKDSQDKYIDSLIKEEGDDDKEENLDTLIFHISCLKILFLFYPKLDKENQTKILNYFLTTFYISSPEIDIELDHIIEERTALIILSLIKPTMSNGEIVQMKQSKAIKILQDLHKNNIQFLIKKKKIVVETSNYMKYFKLLSKEDKDSDLKNKLITKLGLVILIFYLKNEVDYQQEMDDIAEIKKFDKDWSKLFTDLILNLLHKGNASLGEFAMGTFKKISKYINKEGADLLIQFLKDTKPKKEKNGMMIDDEEIEEEDEKMEEVKKVKEKVKEIAKEKVDNKKNKSKKKI